MKTKVKSATCIWANYTVAMMVVLKQSKGDNVETQLHVHASERLPFCKSKSIPSQFIAKFFTLAKVSCSGLRPDEQCTHSDHIHVGNIDKPDMCKKVCKFYP